MSGQELENWNADSVTSDLREQVEDLGPFEDPLRDIVYNKVSCKSVGWRKIVSDNRLGSSNGDGKNLSAVSRTFLVFTSTQLQIERFNSVSTLNHHQGWYQIIRLTFLF